MKRKLLRRAFFLAVILLLYPIWVIGFTWSHVSKSDFEGGRHGQLDAYRHALASATVSNTLGEWAVTLTTLIFESRGKESNDMDIHNNRLGAAIGSNTNSFRDIEPAVHRAVAEGRVFSKDPTTITWLPPAKWRHGKFW
ncbi:DUF6973 domain-containing protein [Luteolibacter sp. AS25]|uniref:DUF6973 domain-containing protein n=1 Tax=Luteolibacter sp. AS25 TaxID=3135776 RepID=UPI00398B4578